MLTRRSLLGSSAVLAAGCSTVGTPVSPSPPSVPQETQLNVATYEKFMTLDALMGCPEKAYRDALAALGQDTENPYGPARSGYRLELRQVEEFFPRTSWATAPDTALDTVAALLEELDADLVTVWPELAQWLGDRGLLLPLDQFGNTKNSALEQEFYPVTLDPYRLDGSLYALPVSTLPLMVFYHSPHFWAHGAPPVDASWSWGDLVENATKLTTYRDDGSVQRWGLLAHVHEYGSEIWWALWQNGAAVLDPQTFACKLQEPAAVEALQFVSDLMHTHRVSPPAYGIDFWETIKRSPPAMRYMYPQRRNRPGLYRMSALPRSQEFTVPVRDGFGIAIASRTQKAEAAYAALQGLTHAMQDQVVVPAKREAVARLKGIQMDLRPEEVAAVEQSLANGRAQPHGSAEVLAMQSVLEDLVNGVDVETAVSRGCLYVQVHAQDEKAASSIPLRPDRYITDCWSAI